jgi:peptidoglycan/xylan/chitin deacetylase (PgdA/CDA1 family)
MLPALAIVLLIAAGTLFVRSNFGWLTAIFPEMGNGLRVLMYHKFSPDSTDYLTVRTADFDRQLAYAVAEGYQFVSMQQVLDCYTTQKALPPKPLLLTFDDAFRSQREEALPILQKYGAKATIFVPTAHIGKDSSWEKDPEAVMNWAELKNLPPSVIECAPHTHQHPNYKNLPLAAIQADVDSCLQSLAQHQLPFVPVFAYAFGARPKNAAILRGMKSHFSARGIHLAFRIGNWVNPLKANDLYELKRIDVRGNELFEVFKQKLKYGRAYLF